MKKRHVGAGADFGKNIACTNKAGGNVKQITLDCSSPTNNLISVTSFSSEDF
jgi:hypothetical protein